MIGSALKTYIVSVLAPLRDLKLVQLHGFGLRRLGITRLGLVEDSDYQKTAAWARAFHRWNEEVDGLVWVSRHYDTSQALVLFGDRVRRKDLEVAMPPLAIGKGPGLKKVRDVARQAGITVLKP